MCYRNASRGFGELFDLQITVTQTQASSVRVPFSFLPTSKNAIPHTGKRAIAKPACARSTSDRRAPRGGECWHPKTSAALDALCKSTPLIISFRNMGCSHPWAHPGRQQHCELRRPAAIPSRSSWAYSPSSIRPVSFLNRSCPSLWAATGDVPANLAKAAATTKPAARPPPFD